MATTQRAYPRARLTALTAQLRALGVATVLLWGCEYGYWHKLHDNTEGWTTVQRLVNAPAGSP